MANSFKIDRVLFATDLSPACEPALRCATALASRFNAELYLLHVVPAPSEVAASNDTSEPHASEAMRRLRQERLGAHDKHSAAVLAGDPATRILQKAGDIHADLIVMGTSGHCPRPGGLTDSVVRGASCPVLAVPSVRQAGTELRT